jgi:hypothetical protein
VHIIPETSGPSCDSFTASASSINSGDPVSLTWHTSNASSVTIDQGVGSVTPVATGSVVVHPTADTTYTATVGGVGNSVTCSVPVHITTTAGPQCTSLTASATTIKSGDAVTLTWLTAHADSVSIDQGVGVVTPTTTGTVIVHPTADTTYTATVPGAAVTDSCKVSVHIDTGGGGCTGSCCSGGCGGGGGNPKPHVVLGTAGNEPLAFIYLSQVPYTGLDLGPIGTVIYWLGLIAWSIAAAYLILFTAIPFAFRKMSAFGADVTAVLNQAPAPALAHADAHASSHAYTDAAPHLMPHAPVVPVHRAPEQDGSAFDSFQGFRSYAKSDELTIDDIVKGLSREALRTEADHLPALRTPAYVAMTQKNVEPIAPELPVAIGHVEPIVTAAATTHPADVRGFVSALVEKDKDAVFGALRQIVRGGGNLEQFLTQATHALDDVFRARIDGTPADPEMVRICSDCDTPAIEKMVGHLATAIDSSYSTDTTGAKLAVTRALNL